MKNTIQLYTDESRKVKGYPITSPDRVLYGDGKSIKDKLKKTVKFDVVGEGETTPPIEGEIDKIKEQVESINEQVENISIVVTPRMTNDNLQEAVDLAVRQGINAIKLEKKTYNLHDTLYIPSNFTLDGFQGLSIISMQGVNKPVIAKNGPISGNTHIRNITIVGDKTQDQNDGIYINDYYSSIEKCTFINCGRHGVYFTNTGASGTLVENKFKSLVFRDCKGFAFISDDGNKCTDATLEDILVNGTSGVKGGIKIGSGAGWFIDKVHIYNFSDVCPFDVRNAFNTNINNIYIENSGTIAMGIYAVQQNCNINNVTIMRSRNMTTGVYLNKSTATNFNAIVNISNLNIVNNIESDFVLIDSDGSNVGVNTSNVSCQGNYKTRVIMFGDKIKKGANYTEKIQVDGSLIASNGSITVDGVKFSPYFSTKWNGSGEKTIRVRLNNLYEYIKLPFSISIFSNKWDVQGGQVKYIAHGMISCKNNISTNAVIYLETGVPTGLSVKPVYTIDTENKELVIKFTPSATDGSDQGVLFIQFGY